MLTPFSDAAVKKYAPAVQPKKLAGPEGALPLGDPNAPGPTPAPTGPISDRTVKPPLGQPAPLALGDPNAPGPTPAPTTSPIKPVDGIVPTGAPDTAPMRAALGAAGLNTSTQSPEDIAKARHDYETYLSEGGQALDAQVGAAGLDAPGGASPYSPMLGSPPATGDLPDASPVRALAGAAGLNVGDVALGDPNAPGPTPAPGSNPIALGDPTKPPPTPTGPKEPAGQIYGPGNYPVTPPDFNTIGGQDVAEAKMPGYVWHHNGQNWDLRPSSMTGTGAAGAGAGPAAPASLEDVLSGKLREVMGRSEVPGRDDPAIAGALAANRLSEQRGAERARAMLAESAARESGGADSGALRTAKMGLNETRAGREGQFAANTILNETKSRRDELQNVLALTGNMLDAKQKNAITQELGRLNAEVSRYGISEGGRQFDVGMGEKVREFNIDDLFRNHSLDASLGESAASRGEAGRQFDTRTAQDQAQWEAKFNRDSLLDVLGALGY